MHSMRGIESGPPSGRVLPGHRSDSSAPPRRFPQVVPAPAPVPAKLLARTPVTEEALDFGPVTEEALDLHWLGAANR